jgi:hypothetical protein
LDVRDLFRVRPCNFPEPRKADAFLSGIDRLL